MGLLDDAGPDEYEGSGSGSLLLADAGEDDGPSAPEPVRQMGSTPGGMSFSASPTEVASWNAGAPRAGTTDVREAPRPPDMDFSAQPMAVPQRGGMEGLYDRLFNGNAQRSYDQMVDRVGQSGAKYETPSIAETYTGAVMGPVVGGIASGAIGAGRRSEADSLGGLALDTAEGGLYGGLAGGASKVIGAGSKYFGNAARWAGDKLHGLADSPMVKRAAGAAGSMIGGGVGAGMGGAFSVIPHATEVGMGAGAMLGGSVANKAVPAAIRGAGSVSRGVGRAADSLQSPAMQAFETMGANQAVSRSLDRSEATAENATNAGRGNLLGDAALEALQTNPSALGPYAGEFAKAAASPEVGAVNTLITKLAQKDPAFRAGPMVELQRMTAEY